jgi:hypothetical protein
MNTYKSVSKQRTLTPSRINTYEKGEGGMADDSAQDPPQIWGDPKAMAPRRTRPALTFRAPWLYMSNREEL